MSGGSLDYLYSKVEEGAITLNSMNISPTHTAFAKHLFKVAKALHDIEWVIDGDMGKGADMEAIMQVITKEDCLETIKEELKSLIQQAEKITGGE